MEEDDNNNDNHENGNSDSLFTALYFFVGFEGRAQTIARDLDASSKRRDQGGGEAGSEISALKNG